MVWKTLFYGAEAEGASVAVYEFLFYCFNIMETNPYSIETIKRELRSLWILHGFQVVHSVYHELLDGMLKDISSVIKEKPVPKNTIVLTESLTPALPSVEIQPVQEVPVVNTQDKKKAHKEAVTKKAEEMKAKGVSPMTLLTLNNMKKWIDEGKTYWWIAEETGASDPEVSMMAKQFGLQSNVSKMVGLKKAKKN